MLVGAVHEHLAQHDGGEGKQRGHGQALQHLHALRAEHVVRQGEVRLALRMCVCVAPRCCHADECAALTAPAAKAPLSGARAMTLATSAFLASVTRLKMGV